jgi:hypothetical protein
MTTDGTVFNNKYVSINGVDVSDYIIEFNIQEKKKGIADGDVTLLREVDEIINIKTGMDIDSRISAIEDGTPDIEHRKLLGKITSVNKETDKIVIRCSDNLWIATGETLVRIYSIEGSPYREIVSTFSDFYGRGEFNNTTVDVNHVQLSPGETSGTYIYTLNLKNEHNFDIIQILNKLSADITQSPPDTTIEQEYSIDDGSTWHTFINDDDVNEDCSTIKVKFTFSSTTPGVTPTLNSFIIYYNNFLGDVYKIFSDICHHCGLNTSRNHVDEILYKIPLLVADNVACYEKMSEIAKIFDWDLYYDSVDDMVCLKDPELYPLHPTTLKIGENITSLPNYSEDIYQTINEVEMQGVTTYSTYEQTFDHAVVGSISELRLVDSDGKSMGPIGDYIQVVKEGVVVSPVEYDVNKDDAIITLHVPIPSGQTVIVNFTVPEMINIVVNDKESMIDKTKRKLTVPIRDVLTMDDAISRGLAILEYGRKSFQRMTHDVINAYNLSCRYKVNYIDNFMEVMFTSIHVQNIKWTFPSPQDRISIGDISFNFERFMITVEERIKTLERKYKEGIVLTENIYDLHESYFSFDDLEIREYGTGSISDTGYKTCNNVFVVKGEGPDGGNEFDQYSGWTDADNVKLGTDYAHAGLMSDDSIGDIKTQYLKVNNFQFNIPEDAIILGIELELTRKASHISASTYDYCVRDYNLTLIKNGKQVFWSVFTPADRNEKWATTDVTNVYGGDENLWGDTWSPSDINNPEFGAMLSVRVQNDSSTRDVTADVKLIRMKVYYKSYTYPTETVDPSSYDSETLKVKRLFKWTNEDELDNGVKDANIDISNGEIEFI